MAIQSLATLTTVFLKAASNKSNHSQLNTSKLASETAPAKESGILIAKLWWMMFLQFAILGAWLPLVFGYLGADGLNFSATGQSIVLLAFPITGIIAVFFGNKFADRNFAAERFLAFSNLVSAVAMLGMFFFTNQILFTLLMWLHCLFYCLLYTSDAADE